MEFDDDDLPDGYTNIWSITVSYLRDHRQKSRGRKVMVTTRSVTEEEREAARARQIKYFTKIGPTDDWQENRRLWNRRWERKRK